MVCQYPIFAKGSKDVPDWPEDLPVWMKVRYDLRNPFPVDMLQKYQLKVKMCCLKCEEKVIEEIQKVPGVFDVRAERIASKVVVTTDLVNGVDEYEVLIRARKIHMKARFVALDAKEKPKKDGDKNEE